MTVDDNLPDAVREYRDARVAAANAGSSGGAFLAYPPEIDGPLHKMLRAADAAIDALEREVALMNSVLDVILEDHRAIELYYLEPDAKLGDVADVKRRLLARYTEEADHD